ncbi:MAG: TonB-dependent receptor [Chlorobi bacterium]|nr:TonB-dependent receptor [Chlorobiota bacterium]
MKFLLPFIFIILFGQNLLGQVTLQGNVVNNKGEALSRINVLVYLPGNIKLVAFAVSNEDGQFQTTVNSTSDSLVIELSSIQYHNQIRSIANTSQNLHFELVPDVMQLETVIIKAAPIEKRGDTISYLVSSFAKKEDRSIEDVLRHMPGIEVKTDGTILYQGMPLQKFYVEGLDLMNGRYGVVSKNLPYNSVGSVEILENNQPIRILQGRVASYQASLNLKLKRNITSTGTAKLGSGLSPFLWDVNITPMIFTKNFQVLLSYQTNNTGNDISKQLTIKTLQDLLQNIDRPVENPHMLNIQTVIPPQIDQNRYLDNNIHLLNFNGLLRISHQFQLRTNLYYINDKQRQQATLQRTLYTPTDTLAFIENFTNRFHNNYLHSEFTLSRNVKKNYLNDELKIETRWDEQKGSVLTGDTTIEQSLKEPFRSVSNDLQSIYPMGKHLIEFKSFISYDRSPHSLEVSPGQFDAVLNKDEHYDKVLQQINLKRFYTDNSASLVFSWKKLSITPLLGMTYRRQQLKSNIFTTHLNEENEAGKDFSNNLKGRHFRAYLQTEIEYRKSRLTINARLPLSWHQVYLSDLVSGNGQKLDRFTFDPRLSADYKINGFWRVRGLWSYANRLGDIGGVYYGYILKNYRFLNRNAAPLLETSHHNFSIFVSYRNPITSFFNSISYIYTISHNNLIYSSMVQSDGTTVLQAFQMPNTTYSHNLHGQTSKYFSAAKATISLQVNFNRRQGKSLINGELFDTKNLFYNLIPDINVRITKWLNSDYSLEASYFQTFIENEKKNKISILRHKLNVFAFPTNNQLISFSSEYYKLRGSNSFFVDLMYRYTFTKKKIDIEFRWNNIFNSKTYTSFQANNFTVWESTYLLRPSQMLLSVRFSF